MKCFVALVVALALTVSGEVEKDEGVLVLTTDNFKETVDAAQYILVEFYAPWCGHCKALKPEYEAAAKKLVEQGSEILLGKVDATQQQSLAEDHGVRGYPTLKFFRNGVASEYTGGRTGDEIVNWLNKKTGPPAVDLDDVEKAKKFIEDNEVAVIGYFSDKESETAKEFLKAAESIEDIPFGISSADDVKSHIEADKDGVVLFKKFDEGRVAYPSELKHAEISSFVTANSLPLVVEFSHETAQKIFGGDIKSHVLIFAGKSGDKFAEAKTAAATVAKDHKGQMLFVVIDTDEEEHARILEFFGMKTEDVPAMRIIQLADEMTKFKPPTNEINEDTIRSFAKDFLAGSLKQHLLSQDLPDDWNKTPVWVLVSTNFDDVAMDKAKDVLVEFYAPWCGHCKQLAPIFDQLGEKFGDRDDIVIAKIDSTANELEHTKIQSFPTLKLYKKETNEVVDYKGARTLDAIAEFMESGGVTKDAASEQDEEEEEEDVHNKDEL